MTTLLRIDSSAQLADRSLTRRLTSLFTEAFQQADATNEVIRRDVGHDPVPVIDHRFIHAAFTPPADRDDWMADRLALSDQLVAEVARADILVLGAPMYNYGAAGGAEGLDRPYCPDRSHILFRPVARGFSH